MSDKKEEVGRGTSERGRIGEWEVREELSVTLMMTLAMGVDNVCQRGRDTGDRQRRQFDTTSSDEGRQGQARAGACSARGLGRGFKQLGVGLQCKTLKSRAEFFFSFIMSCTCCI